MPRGSEIRCHNPSPEIMGLPHSNDYQAIDLTSDAHAQPTNVARGLVATAPTGVALLRQCLEPMNPS